MGEPGNSFILGNRKGSKCHMGLSGDKLGHSPRRIREDSLEIVDEDPMGKPSQELSWLEQMVWIARLAKSPLLHGEGLVDENSTGFYGLLDARD